MERGTCVAESPLVMLELDSDWSLKADQRNQQFHYIIICDHCPQHLIQILFSSSGLGDQNGVETVRFISEGGGGRLKRALGEQHT